MRKQQVNDRIRDERQSLDDCQHVSVAVAAPPALLVHSHLVLALGRKEPRACTHADHDEEADKDAPTRQKNHSLALVTWVAGAVVIPWMPSVGV